MSDKERAVAEAAKAKDTALAAAEREIRLMRGLYACRVGISGALVTLMAALLGYGDFDLLEVLGLALSGGLVYEVAVGFRAGLQ